MGIDWRVIGKRQKVNDPKKIYLYKDENEGKIYE